MPNELNIQLRIFLSKLFKTAKILPLPTVKCKQRGIQSGKKLNMQKSKIGVFPNYFSFHTSFKRNKTKAKKWLLGSDENKNSCQKK